MVFAEPAAGPTSGLPCRPWRTRRFWSASAPATRRLRRPDHRGLYPLRAFASGHQLESVELWERSEFGSDQQSENPQTREPSRGRNDGPT
jgi:hypothetical protein